MRGAPHRQARSSARSFFLLPLVLALLALVAFPFFAEAAGIPEYHVGEGELGIERESVGKPKSSGGQHSQGSETQTKAHGSAVENSNGSEEPTEEEPEEGSSHANANGGGGKQSGGGGPPSGEGGKGGGKPSGGGTEGKVGPGEAVSGGEAQAKPVASQTESSGGGSSPVVPILIAVVVLAAISIGVVIYRQRKSGPGQDGRVSSTNAS